MGAVDAKANLADRQDGGGQQGERTATDLARRLDQMSDRHPSGARYASDSRRAAGSSEGQDNSGGPDRIRPFTDAEHAEHVTDVRARLADAHGAGLATDRQYTIDAKGRFWADDRDALHDALVADLYAAADAVPCEGSAIFAGGLGGAGKTTVLTGYHGIDLARYLTINPDAIKGEMAHRGLIPDVSGLSPMEASDLAHEESSHIAKRLAHRAQADRKNVIWDITMSTGVSTADRIDSLRQAGYTRIEGVFVDIPVEVSVRRADARHREGHDDFRAGDGFGGRYVPPEVIRSQAEDVWGSQNRANFEQVKDRFDAWSRYDNSVDDRPPVLAETSSDASDDDVRTGR